MSPSPIAARLGRVADQPLADEREAQARRARSREHQVSPINRLLRRVAETLDRPVPLADPAYAGVNARVVILARSCGKGAATTGITSWDTPDQSARNLRGLILESALNPAHAALINALPAPPLDRSSKLRDPTKAETQRARETLPELLALFETAHAVVALGNDAHRFAEHALGQPNATTPALIHAPNPSPRVVKVTADGLNHHARALLDALRRSAHTSD